LSSNPNFNSSASLQRDIDCLFQHQQHPPLPHIKTGTVEFRANLVIAIPETGQSFECDSDWTIGDTEVGIRKDHHYRDGSIKLKNASTGKEISTREAKSLAEEIRRMTGEGIETRLFYLLVTRLSVKEEKENRFTFVHGEKISTQQSSKSSCRSVNKIIYLIFLIFLLMDFDEKK
jgi:hypothetical protein